MSDSLLKSESAVSEVVGNLLVFAMVVVSIGLVTVIGGPVVESAQDAAKIDYITSTFVILQSDLNRVAYNQAPFQNTGLKLGGGSITRGSDDTLTNITVYINGTNFSCNDYIEYVYKGTHISYINGGVYEFYPPGNAQMISAPRIFVRQNMTYVSLYHLSGNVSRGGIGNVQLSMKYNSTTVNAFQPVPGNNLTIELQGQYADVQGRYLEHQGFHKVSDSNYSIATDHVTVCEYFVTISD